MTLNEIVYSVVDFYGQTKNRAYVNRIKSRAKDKFAVFVRRDVAKNGASAHYISTITVPLTKVDFNDDCSGITTDCNLLRTKNKIPSPVRLDDIDDFFYVGLIGGKRAFSRIEFEDLVYTTYNKFTSKTIKYSYSDQYLYFFNNLKIKNIWVSLAFENIEQLVTYCNDESCYNDDMEFPISRDMADIIIQELIKENTIIQQPETKDIVPVTET